MRACVLNLDSWNYIKKHRMETFEAYKINFDLHFILISFFFVYYSFKQAIARCIWYLLPCSHRFIHFFQSLDYKKTSQNKEFMIDF
jgi:hypothetical protein